jgi:hypothetical protein
MDRGNIRKTYEDLRDKYELILANVKKQQLLISLLRLLVFLAGVMPLMVFLLLYCFNVLLIGVLLTRINRIHEMISRKHMFLSSVEQLVKSFEKEQFSSTVLTGIQEKIFTKKGSVAERIRKLDKLIRAFDSRLNLFVGFILNGLLLWDFNCIMRLEK